MNPFRSEWLGAPPLPVVRADFRSGYGNRIANAGRFGPANATGRRSAPSQEPRQGAAGHGLRARR